MTNIPYFVFIVILLVSLSVTGCTTPQSEIEVTINSINRGYELQGSGGPGFEYQIIYINFCVKNVGNPSGFKFDPYSVTILDANNHQYQPDIASGPDALQQITIPLGETRCENLVFKVPPSSGMEYSVTVKSSGYTII